MPNSVRWYCRWPLVEIGLFFATALVFWPAGFEGRLTTDDAFYFYSGRRLVEGVPPFVSGFDNKLPGAPIIIAAFIWLGNRLGMDALYAARIAFLGASCLVVVGIYRLCLLLTGAIRIAMVAAFLTTTFYAFGQFAGGGPTPYTLVALFVTWSLLSMVRQSFGRAALWGTVSGIVWQPTLFYGLFPAVLAWLGPAGSWRARVGAVVRVLIGFIVPLAALAAFFAYSGALDKLVEDAIVYNVKYLDRGTPMIKNPWWMVRAVILGFPEASGLIVLGLLALPAAGYARIREIGLEAFLRRDPWRVVVLSVPAPIAWSILDFQTSSDFFVFIPYAVVGVAWLLWKLDDLTRDAVPRALWRASPACALVLIALYSASLYRLRADGTLVYQQKISDEIQATYGADTTILTIQAPEFLVLAKRTTPARLLALVPSGGLAEVIAAAYPNGFDGLIAEIEASRPRVVLVGYIDGKGLGPIETWLEKSFELRERAPWRIYVRRTTS